MTPTSRRIGAAGALALEEDAEQQVLGADELVAHLLRLLHGEVQGGLGARRHVEHLVGPGRAAGARPAGSAPSGRRASSAAPLSMPSRLRICSTTPPGRLSTPISRCSVPSTLPRAAADDALRRLEGLAGPFGELVHVHRILALPGS